MRTWLLIIAAVAACKSTADQPREASKAAPVAPAPVVAPIDAPAASPGWSSPEALWAAYRDAHVGATTANVGETGRKLWPMLGADARDVVMASVQQQLTALAGTTSIKVSSDELAFKVLGETAAARADFITGGELADLERHPDRQIGGRVVGASTIRIRKAGEPPLELQLERVDGSWRFAPAPGLILDDAAVFKTPAGQERAEGRASLDAVAARWTEILDKGSGWDAYNLMSPAMRQRLLGMIAQAGGDGAGDVAKVFEKTIADRRTRGVHVASTRITDRSAHGGSIVVTYSDGSSDTFIGVLADGSWWLEMPL